MSRELKKDSLSLHTLCEPLLGDCAFPLGESISQETSRSLRLIALERSALCGLLSVVVIPLLAIERLHSS